LIVGDLHVPAAPVPATHATHAAPGPVPARPERPARPARPATPAPAAAQLHDSRRFFKQSPSIDDDAFLDNVLGVVDGALPKVCFKYMGLILGRLPL
jgi:hypothetical protein